jgi:hypothetical protein
MGGFGGGGFGRGGFGGGGFGRGGFGGGFGRRGFGGFGGFGFGGFYPGFYGYGLGYDGYGLGYGYGYPGYGYGYGFPGYGYGYGYPGYGYGYPGYMANAYPYSAIGVELPATGFGYNSAYVAPAAGAVNAAPPQRRILGIDEEPIVGPDARKAMKVTNVYPGTAAEKAGLHPGDVIRSINGYLTEQRGNLAWIIANAAPNNELKMTVQTAKDGLDHLITATLP